MSDLFRGAGGALRGPGERCVGRGGVSGGVRRPDASSLNVALGATTANLLIAKVGANGQLRLDNDAGGVDLIADVTGYFI